MAVTTTSRPAPLPQATGAGKTRVPDGAVKMARAYLDEQGLPQKAITPVPVDADEHRTPHLLKQCTYMRVINGGGKERCATAEWMLPDAKPRFCPEHGDELEAPKAGPSVFALTVQDAVKLHGRSAAPWLLPISAAAADTVAHFAGIGPLAALVGTPAAVAATYAVSKYRLTAEAVDKKRIEQGQRKGKRVEALKRKARRNAAVAAEAGVWLTALTATDVTTVPGLIVAAAGMVRWAVGSYQWWAAAEDRRTRGAVVEVEQPDPAPQVEAPDPVKLRALTTWISLIGCAGGPLAGTELVDFQRLPACEVNAESRTMLPNWSAKVVAKVEGSINMRESRPALLGRIAAAYKCTYADVSFAADEADLSVATLRIQPDNPLAAVRMWTGHRSTNWKTGTSVIGRFDDGRPMLYQWWDEGGACHDLLGGCSGSGKSEAVAQLILTSLHSNGLVIDWVGDPQRGQSFGALKGKVDWFAGSKSEIKLMLLAAVKEMWRRNDELARNEIKTWRPTRDMPLLVITLDEVQSYIEDPDILALVELLAGQARKCGIKVRLLTQIIAAYNLGGSTYIKEQVKTGQTFTFRAETDVAGRSAIEGDSPIDPTMLPKKWGPYTCAAGKKTAGLVFMQGVHGRDVYGRTDYTGDDMNVWLVDGQGRSTLSPGVFNGDAQLESGPLWGDRKARALRLIEAGRDDADILPGGRALELIEAASVTAVAVTPTPPGAGQPPAQDRARDTVLAVARDVADDTGLVKRDAIVAGTKGKMADGTRDKALTELVASGGLRRIKNGLYEVAK